MTIHTEITPTEVADRLAIRELVDAYAHCADRRDAEGQKSLFTKNTHFVVHMGGQGSEPTQVLDGREALTPVFEDLNRYTATMHFNGQSTIVLDGDRATGESYCMAHHLSVGADGQRTLMIAAIRYYDTFANRPARGCSPSAGCWSTGSRHGVSRPDTSVSRHPVSGMPAVCAGRCRAARRPADGFRGRRPRR